MAIQPHTPLLRREEDNVLFVCCLGSFTTNWMHGICLPSSERIFGYFCDK
jgi:hypothetical protein